MTCRRMSSALFKYLGERAKPKLTWGSRAQNQAAAEAPEQSIFGLYQGRKKRAIVDDKNNLIVMSNVSRGVCHTTIVDVRAVQEGHNRYTLVPDNNRRRRGVIKINADHELTFSDHPNDEDKRVMFETSRCESGGYLRLTLIDSEVHGTFKLHVRSNNVLEVDGEKYSGFQIRHP